jgi:GTP diphosphokinase / guanosine-3',5'-bis(diphosphate) 3'-diphosphatase
VDVDAGHGAALGRALPAATSQAGSSSPLNFTRRLRSLLSFQGNDDDPVSTLARTHRGIHPSADVAVLRRSYAIAESMHRGQFRKSGDPYITHPLAVAQICAELGMDTTTLVAALLHDTVEDTSYTLEALHGDFGPEVTHLVDGVTKFDKAFYGKAAEGETIRKMIVAAGKDVRVLVIKLADRLHNMRTLDARSPASRARIANATLDVLVPLCDRLGIQALKRDLDDVVLFHLEPESFARIDEHVKNRPGWNEYLADVSAKARAALRRSRVDAQVTR